MITVIEPSQLGAGVLVPGQFAVDGTAPEKIQVTTPVVYRLSSVALRRAPVADLAVQASRTINTGEAEGQFWGIFLIQINAAGEVTTLAPSADQVHATEAAAIAAKPAPSADHIGIGYLTIQTLEDADWTSQTDSLTDDVAVANFYAELAMPRVIKSDQLRPRALTWVGPTDAAHQCELADGPNVIWSRVADAGLGDKDDPFVFQKFDRSLTRADVWTLQSGKLFIYH